ncbi:hypothetical protein NQZ68_032318 [Dissostichus eleginoides]|nr:hypothetical protein NQZ68_032318 [Dissostichus eleginoides]
MARLVDVRAPSGARIVAQNTLGRNSWKGATDSFWGVRNPQNSTRVTPNGEQGRGIRGLMPCHPEEALCQSQRDRTSDLIPELLTPRWAAWRSPSA